ncbi:HEAT repeat domain-containing protein [Paenibacillus macerans]|uniref:HEAT repeat domain-containing protein n=1 Tax=Paenibacillus macerans TaxID=44252 RepID=UPI00203AB732|nr:HEAT repeat domain-containing protein [Paenibacillus macerans]MCM3701384.1 HEAT repeat domain-containing protein [Paenibacillus macerans]
MPFSDIFKSLNIVMPGEVLGQLNGHFLLQEEKEFYLRMLSHDEIAELHQFMSDMDEIFQSMIPIWTDDNSNYVGIYFKGPLSYRVCYLNHEETDLSPAFRSAGSFIAALEQNPNHDWDDLKKDYPQDQNNNNESSVADLQSIEQINHMLQTPALDDDVRSQYIYSVLALTPYNHLDTLLKFLDDEDMYVQERACDILGYHKYLPAREKLRELLEHGMHNGRLAAKRALARLGI